MMQQAGVATEGAFGTRDGSLNRIVSQSELQGLGETPANGVRP